MFPTQSKVSRLSRLWLLPVVALAMLLVGYALFATSTVQAQTPAGEFCIEGIVIDWEENPLAGWQITLTADVTIPNAISGTTMVSTTFSAPEPEDDDDDYGYGNDNGYGKNSQYNKKNNFSYPEDDPDFEKGEFAFRDLLGVAANYTATIESRPGWEGVTPTTLTFSLDVGEEDCARIRFKMRRIVPVTVFKIDANHEPLGDWIIRAVPGPGNLFASPQEETTSDPMTVTLAMTGTDGISPTVIITGGTAVFTLTPGLWIFTEQAPRQDMDEAPNNYVPIVPPNGRQELFIPDPEDLDPDEAFTLVFKNELVTGCFIVRKLGVIPAADDSPPLLGMDYGVAGWGFKLLRRDGTVARQGVTDGSGELRFDNLPLGPYVIVEEDRPGWDEISAIEQDILVTGNLCDEDTDPVVEFSNMQDESGFCIEGRKIDANGGFGIMNWEISAEPLDEGGFDPDNVFTDGEGEFQFDFPRNDYRIPGAKYEICEQAQDGWLPHNPTCQTVRLPEWPGACVELEDFVNQQVGHSESEKHDDHGKGDGYGGPDDHGKSDGYGGPEGQQNGGPDSQQYGGPDGQQNGGQSYGGPNGGQGYNDSNHSDSNHSDSNHSDGQQCSSYHVVKAGEGLYDIGAQYKKSPQEMLDANPSVRDGDNLWVYEGQHICIP
jgi:hypothetical protein